MAKASKKAPAPQVQRTPAPHGPGGDRLAELQREFWELRECIRANELEIQRVMNANSVEFARRSRLIGETLQKHTSILEHHRKILLSICQHVGIPVELPDPPPAMPVN